MQTPANFHWVKLFILVLLPFLSGVSLPAYACSPEARIAIAHLQKSAKARISAEIWFAQIMVASLEGMTASKALSIIRDPDNFKRVVGGGKQTRKSLRKT